LGKLNKKGKHHWVGYRWRANDDEEEKADWMNDDE